jgi:hypothetical protein
LSEEFRVELFQKFYKCDLKEQRTFLMNLIELLPVQRRRKEGPSKRQTTIVYTLPNQKGKNVQVCKNTFCRTFDVKPNVIRTITEKKKRGDFTFIDQRGSHEKEKKYNENHENCVVNHINKFPRTESHYSRAKTSKEYLSPDLNTHRLWKLYQEENPCNQVSYMFFKKVKKEKFANLAYGRPRSDTCRTCDLLSSIPSASTSTEKKKMKYELEFHQRRAEKANELMKADIMASQLPGNLFSVLAMDLEKVLFLPTLTHSDMFYKRQLSVYNLGIHLADFGKGYMHMWHECIAGRGGNEISSCLLHILNKESVPLKKNLIIWSDNCIGQNKNRMIIFLYVYLTVNGTFDSIEHRYLVSGHSFLPCDRDFAQIEKRKVCLLCQQTSTSW